MGLLGIILSLFLLMYLAYRGLSVIVIAPLLALLATLFQGNQALMGTFTQIFMQSMGSFVVNYFPIFLLGAIFGKLLEMSGCALGISRFLVKTLGARWSIAAIVLACGVLTYGGVSAFVVAFSIYPLAAAAFSEAGVPRRLIPASIALGAFTFSMTCLPGTVQIHNVIPMTYFGTDAYAAPLLGILAGTAMFLLGVTWLNYRAQKLKVLAHDDDVVPVNLQVAAAPVFLSFLPIFVVIALNLYLAKVLIPTWDTDYLKDPKYVSANAEALRGMWAMITALFVANIVLIVLHWNRLKHLGDSIRDGALSAMLPTFNTASEVGYGATIKSLASFVIVKDWIVNLSPTNPLLSEVAAVNVLAGITGSAAGGLSIALQALGDNFAAIAADVGVSGELMHRFASMASGGLDTMPHNGAVITLLTVCGLSHKQSYKDIAVVSVLIPFVVTIVGVAIVTFI